MKKLAFIFLISFCANALGHIETDEPFISTQRIEIPKFKSARNSSLLQYEQGYLLTFRYDPKYTIKYMGIVQLDANFRLISQPKIFKNFSDETPIPTFMEDARIFAYNNEIYLLYNGSLDPSYKKFVNRRDMFISKLSTDCNQFSLSAALMLINPEHHGNQLWEKNWVPFVWKDNLMMAYSFNPHEIMITDLETGNCPVYCKTTSSVDWKWGEIRGGTPAQLVDGDYLAFFHSSIDFPSGARHYYIGAYTFASEPPFQITKITLEPLIAKTFYTTGMKSRRSIFPCGYTISDEKIYLTYGKNNSEVWIATIDKSKLYSLLSKVETVEKDQ